MAGEGRRKNGEVVSVAEMERLREQGVEDEEREERERWTGRGGGSGG